MSSSGESQSLGFTLVELLVVIAIIAVLAGLLFPVFSSAKKSAKRTDCLSNLQQIGMGTQVYLSDSDDVYPQTRQHSSDPAHEDVSGSIDEPIFQESFSPIQPYVGSKTATGGQVVSPLFACPEDPDPFGRHCLEINPDSPDVTSYLVNAYFVFGLALGSINNPASTIYVAERRSAASGESGPFCDDIYHPWFSAANPQAPEIEMDPVSGAIAESRHMGLANYDFADGHAKALHWANTFSPPAVNLHLIVQ